MREGIEPSRQLNQLAALDEPGNLGRFQPGRAQIAGASAALLLQQMSGGSMEFHGDEVVTYPISMSIKKSTL